MSKSKQKKATKLIERAEKSHRASLRALGDSYRVQGGTTTYYRHYARYERNAEAFDDAMRELRTLVQESE